MKKLNKNKYYGGIKETNTRSAITVDKKLYSICKQVAREERRSFSNLCISVLEEYLRQNYNKYYKDFKEYEVELMDKLKK